MAKNKNIWAKKSLEGKMPFGFCITKNDINKCQCGKMVKLQYIAYSLKKGEGRGVFIGKCSKCHAIFYCPESECEIIAEKLVCQ